MGIESFQFLMGLLEFGAALNLGFVISEGFRNQPRKNFETEYSNWLKLESIENNEFVKKFITESNEKGEQCENKQVRFCKLVGLVALVFAAILALLPVSFFSFTIWSYSVFYLAVWLFAVLVLFNIVYTYWKLQTFWENELNNLQRIKLFLVENTINRAKQ